MRRGAGRRIEQRQAVLSAVATQTELARSLGVRFGSGSSRLLPSLSRRSSATQQHQQEDIAWQEVEKASKERGDADQPCPICRETYNAGTAPDSVVLLSCSHIFHRVCIESFEKFSSGIHVCPLCRTREYRTRTATHVHVAALNRAAATIQARWRGHQVRTWIRRCQQQGIHPLEDPTRIRNAVAERIAETSSRLIAELNRTHAVADALLVDIARSVDSSRMAMQAAAFGQAEWTRVETEAVQRGLEHEKCAICLCGIVSAAETTTTRPLALTSCAHVFHSQCLASFESFNARNVATTHEGAAAVPDLCPVCRAVYCRRHFVVNIVSPSSKRNKHPIRKRTT